MSSESTVVPAALFSKPSRVANSRAHLAFNELEAELAQPEHGQAALKIITGPGPVVDVVGWLISQNQKEWDDLINNKFCQQMAEGTASLNGFNWYMVQDMLFLKDYVYWKLGYYSKAPWPVVVQRASKSIGSDISWVQYMRDICVGTDTDPGLGIPANIVDHAQRADVIQDFRNFMVETIAEGDYFSLNVVLVPSSLGYCDIAGKYIDDPSYKNRDTVFWKYWVGPNDPKQNNPEKYKNILNSLLKIYDNPVNRERWSNFFKTMCKLETQFFNDAMTHHL